MRILIVDDDAQMRSCLIDELSDSDCVLKASATLIDWPCDVLLIDLSSVGAMYDVTRAYRPICQWHERHPGTTIMICSAHDSSVLADLIEMLAESGITNVESSRKGGEMIGRLMSQLDAMR